MNKECYYYKKEKQYIVCELCPKGCRLSEGQTGACMVRKVIEGKLIALNYGRISSVAIDPIEKKPLYHFEPGKTVFSVGTYGCNLSCVFCQNHSISRTFKDMGNEVMPERIVELCQREGQDIFAFTYNEPTVFYEFVLDTAKILKEKGIKTVLVTNGYINEEPLLELLPYIDALNIDVKSCHDEGYRKLLGGSLEPVIKTVDLCHKMHKHVELTCLIVPELFNDRDRVNELFKRLSYISNEFIIHLSRFFPRYQYEEQATDIELMLSIQEIARKYFQYVYLGNV